MSTPPLDESSDSALVRCSSPPRDDGAAAKTLMDELLLEIISRVPARERWRCKQVCKHWLRLAKTLPQSLAGFFYTTFSVERLPAFALHFFSVSGNFGFCRPIYLDFNFLPDHRRIDLLDCRNGLILCSLLGASAQPANKSHYAVCNPATQQWVTLPDRSQSAGDVIYACLGFDPAASSHFHVFMFLDCDTLFDLYSSKTGRWVRKEKRCNQGVWTECFDKQTVFLNGYLHLHAFVYGHGDNLVPCLAAVATDGTSTTISVPYVCEAEDAFIQLSQGRLHYACLEKDDDDDDELAIYVLEDYDSKQWKLKHRVQTADLFEELENRDDNRVNFDWVAIHPECNVIFFAAGDPKQYMWYNMDLQKKKVMRTLRDGRPPYLPYAPLHTELQSLRM